MILSAFVCVLLFFGGIALAEVELPLGTPPIVIAHRGASGYLPEHTLAAYERAMQMGADYIEPDLVSTRDGHLIARHESRLDSTTDVASHPELAHLRTTKQIDGRTLTGWFSEDLTLAQIKSLKARERLSKLRTMGVQYDGQYEVPTLAEILALLARWREKTGVRVGIYPETKHPSHFSGLGLGMEEQLVRQLQEAGYRSAEDPVYIQSFEIGNLKALNQVTEIRLVQLLLDEGGPYDRTLAQDPVTYAEMATREGLRAISEYADGVGPYKGMILSPTADGALMPEHATQFVADAHAFDLVVHPYTFRAENDFLPDQLKQGDQPGELGDLGAELDIFIQLGVDGFFTDHADLGVAARKRAHTPASR